MVTASSFKSFINFSEYGNSTIQGPHHVAQQSIKITFPLCDSSECSSFDNINIRKYKMAVKFVNISRETFRNEYERLYWFTTLDRFIESLSSGKFAFVNPSSWPDPYERFFLERDFIVNSNKLKLPAKDKLFAVCVSGTISSEAYWKVYAPKKTILD